MRRLWFLFGHIVMDKKYSIALVVLLLGGAGGLYYWQSGQINDLGAQRGLTTHVQCAACDHGYTHTVDAADQPPFECPKCKKSQVWYKWQCGGCGAEFLPPTEGDPPRQPMMPACPKCKGQMTGRMSVAAP